LAKLRTFIDSGVLIIAARGTQELSGRAIAVLADPQRTFITSDFVMLEVLPKAHFHRKSSELEFYEAFFQSAQRTIRSTAALVTFALEEARLYGLSAVDALHIAAAKRAKCDEFVTTENPTKAIFAVADLLVTSLRIDVKSAGGLRQREP
jgi:predicted nucleic acid-binding protein